MRRKHPVKRKKAGSVFYCRCRGSFTVEASFLYPILVLLIAFLLTLSIGWEENVRTAAEDTEELRELDLRTEFLESWGQSYDK